MAIVGIDIGYGYTKAVCGKGEVCFQSVTGPSVRIKFKERIYKGGGSGSVYTLNGRSFFVGEQALLQSKFINALRARERTDTEHFVMLFVAALHRLGVDADSIRVVTGLPVAWYDDRAKVESVLKRLHVFYVDETRYSVNVEDVYVIPQPVGSVFYLLLDDDGKLINDALARMRIAVIDIGMYTTDYCLIDQLRYVEKASGSISVGMGQVYDLIGEELRDLYDLEVELHQVDRIVREGVFRVNGQELMIEFIAGSAMKEVCEKIVARARELWGNARDIDRIVLTGGGAIPLRDRFASLYPQMMVTQSADMANARGFYRRGRRLWNGNGLGR